MIKYILHNESYLDQEIIIVERGLFYSIYCNTNVFQFMNILDDEESRLFVTEHNNKESNNYVYWDMMNIYEFGRLLREKIKYYGYSKNENIKKIEKDIELRTSASYVMLKCKIEDILASI